MQRDKALFIFRKAFSRGNMIQGDFYGKSRYYSLWYAFVSLIWWIGNYCVKLSSWKRWADRKKRDWQNSYFEENYADVISRYRMPSPSGFLTDEYKIWVFWAQGKEEMPPLVKCCYENLCRKSKQNEVVFITMNNIDKYLKLPKAVFDCLHSGMIGYTHLSDIIRNSLLAQYGGLWIDATVWITKEVPIDLLSNLFFFSAKQSSRNSHWVSYLIGTNKVGMDLFCFVRDMLVAFCEREKYWPDYLVQDYLIGYAYQNFPHIRKMMDTCPDNNPRRSDLWIRMNKPFYRDDYNMLITDNWMYKLSYKSDLRESIDGQYTYYGAMIKGIK